MSDVSLLSDLVKPFTSIHFYNVLMYCIRCRSRVSVIVAVLCMTILFQIQLSQSRTGNSILNILKTATNCLV